MRAKPFLNRHSGQVKIQIDGIAAMAITKSRFRADAERKQTSAPSDWTAYVITRRR